MTDTKKSKTRKSEKEQKTKHLINVDAAFIHKWLQIICLELPILFLLVYIVVQILFFKTFKCSEHENIRYCQCVQISMSEEVSFLGKVKLILINPPVEDMGKYVSLKNSAKCRIQNMDIVKSMQDYGTKAKDSIKDLFDN